MPKQKKNKSKKAKGNKKQDPIFQEPKRKKKESKKENRYLTPILDSFR